MFLLLMFLLVRLLLKYTYEFVTYTAIWLLAQFRWEALSDVRRASKVDYSDWVCRSDMFTYARLGDLNALISLKAYTII